MASRIIHLAIIEKLKKALPMLILLVAPYLFVIIVRTMIAGEEMLTNSCFMSILKVYVIMCLIVFLPNMIYAFLLPKIGYAAKQILFWDMILKICNIPIYILIFMIGFILLILPMGFLLLFIPIIFDYILLLPSTMYGISGLIQARKENLIQDKNFVIHIILHFMFCLDLVSAIISYCTVRKE